MQKILLVIAANVTGILIGWLVCVGAFWLALLLLKLAFGFSAPESMNIWAAGALVYFVWFLFLKSEK